MIYIPVANHSLCSHLSPGASVVAKLGFGALSDYVSPWILALFSLTCTSIATFIIWGVTGHIVAGVLVFGVVYGSLAGGWFAIWGAFVKGITSEPFLSLVAGILVVVLMCNSFVFVL